MDGLIRHEAQHFMGARQSPLVGGGSCGVCLCQKMSAISERKEWDHPVRSFLECLGTIGAGLLYAVALKYFVFPAKVILTGFEGIAAATAYFHDQPWLFLLIYAISQAILIIFAFAKISRAFVFRTNEIEPVVNALMYTAIYIITSAETLNNFFRKFKFVMPTIVTKEPEELGQSIMDGAPHRTFTIQNAFGGYSSEPMKLVRTILTHQELPDVLDSIRRFAPGALWFHHDIEGISSRYEIKPIG